jgi:hypothetical protein
MNEAKNCKAKGCNRKRITYSSYCNMHGLRVFSYGDVEGRRIYPKEYQSERMKVQQLLQANSNHEGIKQGVAFFSQWIESACTTGGVLAQRAVLRLQDEGIKGEELLEEVAALYLFSWSYPWVLQEGLPLDYACGIAVLTKSHRRCGYTSIKGVKMSIRRQVGKYVREKIGRLLFNIVSTIRKKAHQEAQESKAQAEALVYPRVIFQSSSAAQREEVNPTEPMEAQSHPAL